MRLDEVVPPGQHRHDAAKSEIDAIGFALDQLKTQLLWIGEHHATFQAKRYTSAEQAEEELKGLEDSCDRAFRHLARLTGLLLAGYGIDFDKKVPPNLMRWLSRIDAETLCPNWWVKGPDGKARPPQEERRR